MDSAFYWTLKCWFGPRGPSCVLVFSPLPGLLLCDLCDLCACRESELLPGVVTADCWPHSSVFSSSPICLRAKNPSWRKKGDWQVNHPVELPLTPPPPEGIWLHQYLPQYEDDQGQEQQASYDTTDQNPQRDGNRSALQHLQHRLPGGGREAFKPGPLTANQNAAARAPAFPPPSRPSLLPGWWGWSPGLWDGRHLWFSLTYILPIEGDVRRWSRFKPLIQIPHPHPTPKNSKIKCRYFSEEVVVNSAADADDDALPLQDLLDVAHHLRAPWPAAVLRRREKDAELVIVWALRQSSVAPSLSYWMLLVYKSLLGLLPSCFCSLLHKFTSIYLPYAPVVSITWLSPQSRQTFGEKKLFPTVFLYCLEHNTGRFENGQFGLF